MKKDYKSLVDQIQKMASPPPAPTQGWVAPQASDRPSVPKPGVPVPGGKSAPTHFVNSGDSDILKMQKAIIQLSKDVVAQMAPKGQDPRSQQEATSKQSFSDFLARTFMNNSAIPAVEFSPNPKDTVMEKKNPTVAHKMSWVMDTMDRLGHAINETFADGIWGPRTNAALSNVYAFAAGLLNVANFFKVSVQSYNEQYLENMKTCIPTSDKDFDLKTKKEAAVLLIKHINAIRKMYDEVKNQVLQLPQYQTYIEGDTPYLTHEQGFQLNPQQLASLKETFAQGFTIPLNDKDAPVKITVDDLVSLDSLNKWIHKFPDAQLDPYNVLTLVSNQVSKGA